MVIVAVYGATDDTAPMVIEYGFPTAPIVVESTDWLGLTKYVPVPPVPVSREIIRVPDVTLVPDNVCPIAREPTMDAAVTFNVVPDMEPVTIASVVFQGDMIFVFVYGKELDVRPNGLILRSLSTEGKIILKGADPSTTAVDCPVAEETSSAIARLFDFGSNASRCILDLYISSMFISEV